MSLPGLTEAESLFPVESRSGIPAERVTAEAEAATGPATLTVEGMVLRTESNFARVLADSGHRYLVNVKKTRGGRSATTLVVIGDRVQARIEGEGGTIEAIHPRRNELFRLAPGRRSLRDVLAANLDQLIVVQALEHPHFSAYRLDRFLAIAEQADIPAVIVLNKDDLASRESAEAIAEVYRASGYPVIVSSAKTGDHIAEVEKRLRGICALVGPSGVGKSTILNAIRPGLRLRTGDVSEVTGKGRHTTVVSELLDLGDGNYVADTPGLRAIGFIDIDRYEVASLFRELRPLIGACRFPDCLHQEEPGCAVRAAVEEGSFGAARYASYLKLMAEVAEGFRQDWELD